MAQYEYFTFDQGSDIAVELHLQDASGNKKNLTNYSGAATMKRSYNSDSSDTHYFDFAIQSPPTDGIVTISLTNTQTDNMESGKYVYDVEISYVDSNANNIIERILEGKIDLTPSVTT
jgi:hypothetical protein